MGQQQLLLIVLGVIVVGIAIVVGINLFNANAIASNRDAVISDLNNLGAMAMSYYKKPESMGGGAQTFTGFSMPTGLDSTANGTYTTVVAAQSVIITGLGTEIGNDGENPVKAVLNVTPTAMTIDKDELN